MKETNVLLHVNQELFTQSQYVLIDLFVLAQGQSLTL